MSLRGDGVLSRRAVEASAMFGLVVGEDSGEYEEATSHADRTGAALHRRLWSGPPERGLIVLVTGPSGSGKSLVLHKLAMLLGRRAIWATDVGRARHGAVVDLFDRPLGDTLRLLARAGLADARLFGRRVRELSEGERFRLSLACAMDRAERVENGGGGRDARPTARPTLLVDEFCTALDRPAAWGVAAMLRRWVGESGGVRVVCATSHEDLGSALRPDVVVRMELGREGRIEERKAKSEERKWEEESGARGIVIRQGTRRDYAELSRFHYRAGAPATWARVVVAEERHPGSAASRHQGERPIAGVLVVSMPALNGPWRGVAWPGLCESGDKREDARRLNAQVRTISRVVVEPRWRGLGVATRLVRAYLDDPLTQRTEAIAAMGACCPLFAAAGMREVAAPRSRRDARLLRALAGEGVEPWQLADAACLRRLESSGALASELRIWADAARGTRGLARSGIPELLRAAARGLGQRAVFVAG